MDCRKFRNNLEDYLQGELDFPGRFGMERHAQQCLHCGRDVAEAQKLGEMARGLSRVKAPPNFEAGLLADIRARNIRRSARFWRYWEYGLEWVSWRSAAVGASAVALLVVAFLAGTQQLRDERGPGEIGQQAAGPLAATAAAEQQPAFPRQPEALPYRSMAQYAGAQYTGEVGLEPVIRVEPVDHDFVEFLVPGPGDRRMIMRLPKAVRMQYETSSEEYFIRNVSH
jgi:hypothetical protein